MEIIDFPGKPRAKAIHTHEHKIMLGPLRFTCECGNVSEIAFNGMIFRSIDFYCDHCGDNYKVQNPVFSKPVKKSDK